MNVTATSPECFVSLRRSYGPTEYVPAKVVREAKSTVTVSFEYPANPGKPVEMTFSKRKVYGEERWEDPRVVRNSGGCDNSSIPMRGGSEWHKSYLTFNVAHVQAYVTRQANELKVEGARAALKALEPVAKLLEQAGHAADSVEMRALCTLVDSLQDQVQLAASAS